MPSQQNKPETARIASALKARSDSEIARLLRRTHQLRARRRTRRAKNVVEWWSEKEIKLLGTRPDEELARFLGRGINTVRYKRERLHIPVFDPAVRAWTRPELRLLGKATDEQVAKDIGRTRCAVQLKRHALGIPP